MYFCCHNRALSCIKYYLERKDSIQWDDQFSKGLALFHGTCSVNFLFIKYFEVLKDIKVLNKIKLYIQNDLAFGIEYKMFASMSIIAFTGSLVLAPMFSLLKSLTVGMLAVVSAVPWALVQRRFFSILLRSFSGLVSSW